ncbi:MAG TPA: Fic family protein [Thermomicrobiales bacterium]|nr:Fic family protein [Thermomicrobiales bacterium]
MIDYLGVGDLLALHAELMGRLGRWPSPLVDEDGLVAELQRPQAAAHFEQADLIRQAAILAVRLAQLRPFVDGNLPTSFAAMESFLGLNGFAVDPGRAVDLVRSLHLMAEERDPDEATDRFERCLRPSVIPAD